MRGIHHSKKIRRSKGFSASQIKALTKGSKKTSVKKPSAKTAHDNFAPLETGKDYELSFVIPFKSHVKERARHSVRKIKRVTGEEDYVVSTHSTKETRDYEKKISMFCMKEMKDAGLKPFDGSVKLDVVFRFNSKDFNHKNISVVSMIVGDIDNHQKSLQDGMNRIVFTDDRLIIDTHHRKEMVNDAPSCIFVKITGTYNLKA